MESEKVEVPSADADTEELQFESPPPASGDEGSSSSQERAWEG